VKQLSALALARAADIGDPGFRALAIYDILDRASEEDRGQLRPFALALLKETREEIKEELAQALSVLR
jgi:hypothetical protein